MNTSKKDLTLKEQYYLASQWQLMRRKFFKHKLGIFGLIVLGILYLMAFFCEFVSPYTKDYYDVKKIYIPPQTPHIYDKATGFHLRPFVYGLKMKQDPITWERKYTIDPDTIVPVYLLESGKETYKMWNLFSTNWHLFGVRQESIHLFGTDKLGRDLLSRTLYASRISLSVGLVGVSLAFFLGVFFGGISGYFGGIVDILVQRMIEFILSLPPIPLWMALAAAFPPAWTSIKIYFAITLVLSITQWTVLARVVRGMLLKVREEDYIMAAKTSGLKESTIIRRHMIPSVTSYLIVHLTLAIPIMVIAETSLSFLGLGIREPSVSWGTMLQDAQNVRSVIENTWILIPAAFVVIGVLAFNFVGDGLRDAADPYK